MGKDGKEKRKHHSEGDREGRKEQRRIEKYQECATEAKAVCGEIPLCESQTLTSGPLGGRSASS